jgi:DNA invertase Pin-like site-specific DNA recombinase
MKYSIYARESSDDTNKAPPIEEQIKRCKQYAAEHKYKLVDVYSDNGFSGGNWNRPAWKQIVKDAKFHRFNIVLVWNQDRIARDTEQFLWFHRSLKEAYVKLYSICDGIINLDSVGDTAKHISIAMASEIFRKVTSEKVRRSYSSKVKDAKKKGIKVNWGRKPGKYNIDLIRQLKTQGFGYREIANRVGGCSYQTIRRLLQNTHDENTPSLPTKIQNTGGVTE